MRIHSRCLSVQGYRCHYTEAGEGPAVVLLASMFVRTRSYRPTVRAMAGRCRIITVSPPGSGRSSLLRLPWSFQDYARWTGQFLAALKLIDVTLIGHSNSGPVALLTPSISHEALRVGRVVLVGTVGAHPHPRLWQILMGRSVDAFLEPLLSVGGWPDIAYNVCHHTRTCLRQLLLCRDDITDEAKAVTTPTMLAWGCRDHTMPIEGLDRLRNALPHAQVYTSRQGSHDWLITQPTQFADLVQRFIKTTPLQRVSEHMDGRGSGEVSGDREKSDYLSISTSPAGVSISASSSHPRPTTPNRPNIATSIQRVITPPVAVQQPLWTAREQHLSGDGRPSLG